MKKLKIFGIVAILIIAIALIFSKKEKKKKDPWNNPENQSPAIPHTVHPVVPTPSKITGSTPSKGGQNASFNKPE